MNDSQGDPAAAATVLARITDGVIALDRAGRVTYASCGAETLLRGAGRPREALLGGTVWGKFPGAFGTLLHRESHRAMIEQITVDFEAFGPALGLWLSARAYPSRDGLSLYLRDITARKNADEARQHTNEVLEDFFENACVGLHSVGPDGIILRVNREELALLGYERDEYVGRHIAEFHVDRAVIDDILVRLTRNETIRDYKARLRCKDGSIKHVLIDASVYREDGVFVHTRCFTRDVTALEHAEAERQRLLERERTGCAILWGRSRPRSTSWERPGWRARQRRVRGASSSGRCGSSRGSSTTCST